MAQTNYTPIQLYYSSTASAVPVNTNLASGELAINITDGKLFYKDNAGAVQTLATKAATSGTYSSVTITGGSINGTTIGATTASTGAFTTTTISTSETLSYGTANGVAYLNGSKVLTTGSALVFDGTNFTAPRTQVTTSGTPPSSGAGLEFVGGATPVILSYNRATSQYLPMTQYGSAFTWSINGGSSDLVLTSTGLGIGTSSPYSNAAFASLSIGGSSSAKTGLIALVTAAGADSAHIDVYNSQLRISTNGTTNPIAFYTGGSVSQNMTLDSSGNLGLGVTPSAWGTFKALQVGYTNIGGFTSGNNAFLSSNAYYSGSGWIYQGSYAATYYQQLSGQHIWYNAPSGTQGAPISGANAFVQAMTLDASGNLRLGNTSHLLASNRRMTVYGQAGIEAVATGTTGEPCVEMWQQATSGNNKFTIFYTEGTFNERGSITYNRAGGLTVYNTTSDYRAKDIYGPITDSGALIDSVPVYMGKMKDATQERPMFIAHETPVYAHTGEKDAVDADGNPVYQQMDASSLIPVMWAEIQSLRKRLAAAGI